VAASAEPIYPEPEPAPVETFAPVEPVEAEPGPEPEPIAAAAAPEPEPQPIAAAAAPEPEPEPEPRTDYVPQPTWQTFAPDTPTTDAVPTAPVQQPMQPPADAVAASGEPQWPASPEWPQRGADVGLPFLGRPAAGTGGIEALWAASAQEVAQVAPATKAAGGVQPCVSCGLSLSATARFCRRCGTRQG
jgi:ribosomal protein L40E